MNAHFKPNAMFGAHSDRKAIMALSPSPRKAVIGPLGDALTLEALPSPGCNRWTPRRKAEVVAAVNGGLLTLAEACQRYRLSLEEFAGWQRAADRSGLPGLRATQAQYYKKLHERMHASDVR